MNTAKHNTPLIEAHRKMNAAFAPFAGWNMPIHYGSIIEEVKYTRSNVSMFDISHMGEFIIREKPDNSSLERIVTVPVTKMGENTCRYGFLLSETGKVLDDLIIYRINSDEWMVVVNAVNIERDMRIFRRDLSPAADFEDISNETVKIDIQGPESVEIMMELAGNGISGLEYFRFDTFEMLGGKFTVSRTGYTGEAGYEIYIDSNKGTELWNELLNHTAVKPAGLGARDILRLEMGYPLYGHELNEETSPLEAMMDDFIHMDKEFTGRDALLREREMGINRRLSAFKVNGRRTPRHKNIILINNEESGYVTSGAFSPHLNSGIGMGYIRTEHYSAGKNIVIDNGKTGMDATIVELPFINETSLRSREA